MEYRLLIVCLLPLVVGAWDWFGLLPSPPRPSSTIEWSTCFASRSLIAVLDCVTLKMITQDSVDAKEWRSMQNYVRANEDYVKSVVRNVLLAEECTEEIVPPYIRHTMRALPYGENYCIIVEKTTGVGRQSVQYGWPITVVALPRATNHGRLHLSAMGDDMAVLQRATFVFSAVGARSLVVSMVNPRAYRGHVSKCNKEYYPADGRHDRFTSFYMANEQIYAMHNQVGANPQGTTHMQWQGRAGGICHHVDVYLGDGGMANNGQTLAEELANHVRHGWPHLVVASRNSLNDSSVGCRELEGEANVLGRRVNGWDVTRLCHQGEEEHKGRRGGNFVLITESRASLDWHYDRDWATAIEEQMQMN